MGLDLWCGDHVVKLGSYKMIQQHRRAWIQADIKRIKKMGVFRSDLIQELEQTVFHSNGRIHYDVFFAHQSLFMEGTFYFVYHSDCDGYWEPGMSEKILESIRTLAIYMKDLEGMDYFFREDDSYFLEDMLLYAIESDSLIRFG